jgi:predicted nucleic acid-binding protein
MIILDTNVLSETFRPAPAQSVVNWLRSQPREDLFITAISEAEIFLGIELKAEGRRRNELLAFAEAYFNLEQVGRILNFDSAASRHYARIAASRQLEGRRISEFDAQIAAITRAHSAVLATRNISDFEGCGIELFDPWKAR